MHGELEVLRDRFHTAGLEVSDVQTVRGTARFASVEEMVRTEVEATPSSTGSATPTTAGSSKTLLSSTDLLSPQVWPAARVVAEDASGWGASRPQLLSRASGGRQSHLHGTLDDRVELTVAGLAELPLETLVVCCEQLGVEGLVLKQLAAPRTPLTGTEEAEVQPVAPSTPPAAAR